MSQHPHIFPLSPLWKNPSCLTCGQLTKDIRNEECLGYVSFEGVPINGKVDTFMGFKHYIDPKIYPYTGHRRITPGHEPKLRQLLYKQLRERVETVYRDQEILVVAGGALGLDTIIIEEALRPEFKGKVQTIVARPFPGHHLVWGTEQQQRFEQLWREVDTRFTICILPQLENDLKRSYLLRNRFMVTLGRTTETYLTAYYDGSERGGTMRCIEYAQKIEFPIKNIYPEVACVS